MKALSKLALTIAMLTAAVSAKAEWVSGYFRSNGTYVAPYYRTPTNGTPYDNLSYRGYPSQQPGYVSPKRYELDTSFRQRSYSFEASNRRSNTDCFAGGIQTMPNLNRTYKARTYSGF